jgi:hypothetical protein
LLQVVVGVVGQIHLVVVVVTLVVAGPEGLELELD